MDEERFDSTPPPFDALTPSYVGEVEVIDGLYLEQAIDVMNEKAMNLGRYWSGFYRDCSKKFSDISTSLEVYNNSEEAVTAIKGIMMGIPSCPNPPALPQLLYYHPIKRALKRKAENCDVISDLKSSYQSNDVLYPCILPGLDINEDITLADLEKRLKEVNCEMGEMDNFNLRNSNRLGIWLQLAYRLFRADLTVRNVYKSFAMWCKERLNITDTRQRDMRKFSGLCEGYPKIIRCRQPVYFFLNNFSVLKDYLEKTEAPWSHIYNCNCDNCIEYFR